MNVWYGIFGMLFRHANGLQDTQLDSTPTSLFIGAIFIYVPFAQLLFGQYREPADVFVP